MCGLAGIVGPSLDQGSGLKIKRMTDMLRHRGPDGLGFYQDQHTCLGHTRLAILDLSTRANQPMKDGNAAIVFNGEIYNYLQLRHELISAGVVFITQSDTEVLIKGYLKWGTQIVGKIRGMYAFAIWDADQQTLFCGRDPFGKKPFYYTEANGQILFASELPALLEGLDGAPEISLPTLAYYLARGYNPEGQTIFDSIKTLPPGHCLLYGLRSPQVTLRRHWQGCFQLDALAMEAPQALETCETLLREAVATRLQSDVPLGTLLSGGVDSSLISCLAREKIPGEMHTFSVAFKGSQLDESRYARQVAERIGSQHLELPGRDSPDLAETLSRLVKIYGEPFGDYSSIPSVDIFQAIKKHITVVLTGDGGDEVAAGYKDVKLFLFRNLIGWLRGLGNLAPLGLIDSLTNSPWRQAREAGYALASARHQGADAFLALFAKQWNPTLRKKFLRKEWWDRTGQEETEEGERAKFAAAGRDDLERYLNRNLERLTQGYMVKVDRAAMASSVEARCPMLDVDLFAFCSQLHRSILLDDWGPKSLFKKMLSRYMGKQFATRPKGGFTPPLAEWLRTPQNSRWAQACLGDKEGLVYSMFRPEGLTMLIKQHGKGMDNTARIWNLLFLNQWHKEFVHRSK